MNTLSAPSSTLDRGTFLRRVLCVDAATCAATGALMAFDAAPLSPMLGLPAALLFWSGLSLFPIGAFILWVGTRRDIPRAGAWLAILGNAGWVAGSALVLALLSPTGLGTAFVIAQAVVVALLADLEYVGLRKAGS